MADTNTDIAWIEPISYPNDWGYIVNIRPASQTETFVLVPEGQRFDFTYAKKHAVELVDLVNDINTTPAFDITGRTTEPVEIKSSRRSALHYEIRRK